MPEELNTHIDHVFGPDESANADTEDTPTEDAEESKENEGITSDDIPEDNDTAEDTEADENADDNPSEDNSGEEDVEGDSEDQGIDTDLVYHAAAAGFELDDIKRFPTKDGLLAAIAIKERDTAGELDKGDQTEPEWFDFTEENAEEIDEELLAPLKKMNDFYKGKLGEAMESVKKVEQQMQQRAQMEYEQQFENSVNGLTDEWGSLFGKGAIEDIKETQFDNRKKLFTTISRVNELDKQKGATRSMAKVINDALAIEFKDKIKEGERKRIMKSAKKRTATHKPNSTEVKPGVDDEDDAINFIRDGLREMGVDESKKAFVPFA